MKIAVDFDGVGGKMKIENELEIKEEDILEKGKIEIRKDGSLSVSDWVIKGRKPKDEL